MATSMLIADNGMIAEFVDGEYRVSSGDSDEFVVMDPIEDGYCIHGMYVGGCGIDWICGACESGFTDSPTEADLDISFRANCRETVRAVAKALRFGALIGANWNADIEDHFDMVVGMPDWRNLARIRRERTILAFDPMDDYWVERATNLVTDLASIRKREDPSVDRHHYTEIDEIHEYGYLPD